MRIVDHSEAVRTKAAERYLLGEMPAHERDQYEEHFFGCLECAQDVRAGASFIDGARDVLATTGAPATAPRPAPQRVAWWNWLVRPAFALPAMALLLLIAVYQTAVEVPRLRSELSQASTPQALPSLSLLSANSRGGDIPEITVPPNKPFGLFVDIPPEPEYPSYSCEVNNYANSVPGPAKFAVQISRAEAKQTVQVLIPPSRLAAGKYVLVVQGYAGSGSSQNTEVARYPFVLNVSR